MIGADISNHLSIHAQLIVIGHELSSVGEHLPIEFLSEHFPYSFVSVINVRPEWTIPQLKL